MGIKSLRPDHPCNPQRCDLTLDHEIDWLSKLTSTYIKQACYLT
jgi:hypothetical protein